MSLNRPSDKESAKQALMAAGIMDHEYLDLSVRERIHNKRKVTTTLASFFVALKNPPENVEIDHLREQILHYYLSIKKAAQHLLKEKKLTEVINREEEAALTRLSALSFPDFFEYDTKEACVSRDLKEVHADIALVFTTPHPPVLSQLLEASHLNDHRALKTLSDPRYPHLQELERLLAGTPLPTSLQDACRKRDEDHFSKVPTDFRKDFHHHAKIPPTPVTLDFVARQIETLSAPGNHSTLAYYKNEIEQYYQRHAAIARHIQKQNDLYSLLSNEEKEATDALAALSEKTLFNLVFEKNKNGLHVSPAFLKANQNIDLLFDSARPAILQQIIRATTQKASLSSGHASIEAYPHLVLIDTLRRRAAVPGSLAVACTDEDRRHAPGLPDKIQETFRPARQRSLPVMKLPAASPAKIVGAFFDRAFAFFQPLPSPAVCPHESANAPSPQHPAKKETASMAPQPKGNPAPDALQKAMKQLLAGSDEILMLHEEDLVHSPYSYAETVDMHRTKGQKTIILATTSFDPETQRWNGTTYYLHQLTKEGKVREFSLRHTQALCHTEQDILSHCKAMHLKHLASLPGEMKKNHHIHLETRLRDEHQKVLQQAMAQQRHAAATNTAEKAHEKANREKEAATKRDEFIKVNAFRKAYRSHCRTSWTPFLFTSALHSFLGLGLGRSSLGVKILTNQPLTWAEITAYVSDQRKKGLETASVKAMRDLERHAARSETPAQGRNFQSIQSTGRRI